ncbi:hypothetical protein ES703_103732 [subsurface metagenome]
MINTGDSTLFHDLVIGAGTSYKIQTGERLDIEPYVIMQSTFFPKDIGTYKHRPKLAELSVGGVFDVKTSNNTNLSVEPYYSRRIWEQELGGKAQFGSKNFGINAGIYATESNYEFCPDKLGYNIGLLGRHKKLEIKLNYKDEQTNYDSEKENQRSLELKSSLNF